MRSVKITVPLTYGSTKFRGNSHDISMVVAICVFIPTAQDLVVIILPCATKQKSDNYLYLLSET